MLLPIHKMSTTIPLVILLIGFLLAKKRHLSNNKASIAILLSILFYLALHLASAYFSVYKSYAYNDLIIKAPLLILPLIFSFKERLEEKQVKWIWRTFLYSSAAVSIFINLRVAYHFIAHQSILSNVDLVNYTIIHPSYLSMYFLFALFVLWEVKLQFFIKNQTLLKFVISFSIIISLFFLGSRIALMGLAFFFAVQLFRFWNWQKASLMLLVFMGVSVLLISQTSFLKARFSKAFKMLEAAPEEVKNYDVDDRIMIWKNVIELIKEEPIWGYTSGDYCYHVLKEKHNESGFGKGYWLRLNAHNQFLESQLALGVLGSISILVIYLLSFLFAIKTKQKLLVYFLIICILFSLVESIFQSQGGVMFFGFFLGLFLHKTKHISS